MSFSILVIYRYYVSITDKLHNERISIAIKIVWKRFLFIFKNDCFTRYNHSIFKFFIIICNFNKPHDILHIITKNDYQ